MAEPNEGDVYLMELNAEQRSAATFGIPADARYSDLAPPLLIIAGAGTGKTKTLTHRVAHLVLKGADPRRMLAGLKKRVILMVGRVLITRI